MHTANVFYVVYGTTLVRAKNKMRKSENQERKKERKGKPNTQISRAKSEK